MHSASDFSECLPGFLVRYLHSPMRAQGARGDGAQEGGVEGGGRDRPALVLVDGFGASADITITLNDAEKLPYIEQKDGQGGVERLFLFTGRETVAGTVAIALTKVYNPYFIGFNYLFFL